jgi:Pyruvate/2-oxoacid:ferredoxin oxidoreductase delta subunit
MAPSATACGVEFHLEEGQCVSCAICADVCPELALSMSHQDLRPTWIASRCTACRICERECPTAAIAFRSASV